jgi:hypothetical protein
VSAAPARAERGARRRRQSACRAALDAALDAERYGPESICSCAKKDPRAALCGAAGAGTLSWCLSLAGEAALAGKRTPMPNAAWRRR